MDVTNNSFHSICLDTLIDNSPSTQCYRRNHSYLITTIKKNQYNFIKNKIEGVVLT